MYVARMHVRGTDGCMDVRMNGGTDVRINDGWRDGWMDGWMEMDGV